MSEGRVRCSSGPPASFPAPQFARVLGVDISIEVRDPEQDAYLDDKYGYCDHRRGRIVLNRENWADQSRETLWHELLHCCDKAMKSELSEEAVSRIARAQIAVMRDNPALVRWLMEDA